MKNGNPRTVLTGDGSHTLFLPALDETYHSRFGAFVESEYVFVQQGFRKCPKQESLSVFEVGFGTGLNCLLTVIAASGEEREVYYTAIEKYPLDDDVFAQLNHGAIAGELYSGIYQAIHQAEWDVYVEVDPGFYLRKIFGDLLEYSFDCSYDLVYFDAFAPEKQPEMWTLEVFEKLSKAMSDEAVLTTYCAKGVVRRSLQAVGLEVERLAGPPGKREILRAVKRSGLEKNVCQSLPGTTLP